MMSKFPSATSNSELWQGRAKLTEALAGRGKSGSPSRALFFYPRHETT